MSSQGAPLKFQITMTLTEFQQGNIGPIFERFGKDMEEISQSEFDWESSLLLAATHLLRGTTQNGSPCK
jgi:hypothetical protein